MTHRCVAFFLGGLNKPTGIRSYLDSSRQSHRHGQKCPICQEVTTVRDLVVNRVLDHMVQVYKQERPRILRGVTGGGGGGGAVFGAGAGAGAGAEARADAPGSSGVIQKRGTKSKSKAAPASVERTRKSSRTKTKRSATQSTNKGGSNNNASDDDDGEDDLDNDLDGDYKNDDADDDDDDFEPSASASSSSGKRRLSSSSTASARGSGSRRGSSAGGGSSSSRSSSGGGGGGDKKRGNGWFGGKTSTATTKRKGKGAAQTKLGGNRRGSLSSLIGGSSTSGSSGTAGGAGGVGGAGSADSGGVGGGSTVPCPVCGKNVKSSTINQHLDMCLNGGPVQTRGASASVASLPDAAAVDVGDGGSGGGSSSGGGTVGGSTSLSGSKGKGKKSRSPYFDSSKSGSKTDHAQTTTPSPIPTTTTPKKKKKKNNVAPADVEVIEDSSTDENPDGNPHAYDAIPSIRPFTQSKSDVTDETEAANVHSRNNGSTQQEQAQEQAQQGKRAMEIRPVSAQPAVRRRKPMPKVHYQSLKLTQLKTLLRDNFLPTTGKEKKLCVGLHSSFLNIFVSLSISPPPPHFHPSFYVHACENGKRG